MLGALFHASSVLAAPPDERPYVPGEPVEEDFEGFAQLFLENHCFDCHDDTITEGDLSLIELGPVDESNASVWKSIWAQVSLQEMPPPKKVRPEVVERLRFSDWIVSELRRVMKDKGGFRKDGPL